MSQTNSLEKYSIDAAADYLGRSERTLRRWLKQKRLSGKLESGKLVFTKSDLDIAKMNKNSIALDSFDRIYADLPYETVAKFRRFMERALHRLDPDIIICIDRKATIAFLAFAPDGYELGDTVFSYFAFNELPDSAVLEFADQHERFFIFDEVCEYGGYFKDIRNKLNRLNIKNENIGTFALLGRQNLPDNKEIADPAAKICLRLDEPQFARTFAQISALVGTLNYPPAVDKLSITGGIKQSLPPATILARLSSFGRASLVPNGNDMNTALAYTLDEPFFFHFSDVINSLEWDDSIEFFGKESIRKIRFYFDSEQGVFSATAMVYPELTLRCDKNTLIKLLMKYLGEEKGTELKGLELSSMRFLLYSIYSIIGSCMLLKKAQEAGVFRSLELDFVSDLLSEENKRLFNFSFGKTWIGEGVYQTIRRILEHSDTELGSGHESSGKSMQTVDNPRERELGSGHESSGKGGKALEKAELWNDKSLDVEACRNDILWLLKDAYQSKKDNGSLSWSKILDYLLSEKGYTLTTSETAIDLLCDQANVKTINYFDDNCLMQRGARLGTFGFWQDHSALTIYHFDSKVRQALTLASRVVELARELLGVGEDEGVPGYVFMQLIVNLLHDLDSGEISIGLYIDWVPTDEAPIAVLPIAQQEDGLRNRLDVFAATGHGCDGDMKNYLHLSTDKASPEELDTLTLSDDINWKKEYIYSFSPQQRTTIESLIKAYLDLGCKSFRENRPSEQLSILASARNKKVVYICAYKQILLWLSNGKNSVVQILQHTSMRFPSNRGGRITKSKLNTISGIAQGIDSLLRSAKAIQERLDAYARIYAQWNDINATLRSNKEYDYAAEIILSTVDKTPRFDDDISYPLESLQRAADIASLYTWMLKKTLTPINESDSCPSEKQQGYEKEKSAEDYLLRLVKICPVLTGSILIHLEKAVKKRSELDTDDLLTLIKAFNLIENYFLQGYRDYSGNVFLPRPIKTDEHPTRVNQFNNYLSLTNDIRLEPSSVVMVAEVGRFLNSNEHNVLRQKGETSNLNRGNSNLSSWITEVLEGIDEGKVAIKAFSDCLVLTFADTLTFIEAVCEIESKLSRLSHNNTPFSCKFGASVYPVIVNSETMNHSCIRKTWIEAYAACKCNGLNNSEMLVTKALYDTFDRDYQFEFTIKNDCNFQFENSSETGYLCTIQY